ncbi:unnamed protein product [Rhizoctonia solani]|uniref:DUF7330 domain-containing protein n=1 Tax=Rhizoctonia solani TaxID=456999 RepID=A0A8H2WAQ8_9AGAM|nr:unnamed protein product [Rhizoctonia solani]
MALRRASNMITPPGLTVPMSEEKNIQVTEKANKPIVGLWRVGSRASWSDESEEHSTSSNIKLRTEKGAIDAHVVVTSYARDDRPQVDVSSTTGPVTIRMTRTENSRFDLHAESHSGNITVYLPTDFHGVIMYRSRHLATFSRLAASLRGVTMTSAPIGCDGEVDCDNTMEVIYSDRPMCCDEIPKGSITVSDISGVHSAPSPCGLNLGIDQAPIQLFNTLFFLWFTAENFFVFTLSLGLRDPTDADPVPYPHYGFGVGRRTLLTPAPWAFKKFRVVSGFNWREEVFVYVPFALYDGWTLFIFAISTFAAFAPNAIYSGLGTKIAAIWLLSLLVATAHCHAFFTPGGNIPGNVAVTWGIFAIFAEQIEPSIKWAALALGIISVFAIARSVYVLAEDIRAGIGGGAIRLPPDEERAPANGANGANGHNDSA